MGYLLCKFTVRASYRVSLSVQKAGNLLKHLCFHFGYQELEEINCHNQSYPKRTQAISFIFLFHEEFEKLLHVIIHTKRIGFPQLGDRQLPPDGRDRRPYTRIHALMYAFAAYFVRCHLPSPPAFLALLRKFVLGRMLVLCTCC